MVAIALPTNPGSTITSSDSLAPVYSAALADTVIPNDISVGDDIAIAPTDTTASANAATSVDTVAPAEISGEDKSTDIYRWTVECLYGRRTYCVNLEDTYCDSNGMFFTDNTGYCGTGICYCRAYDVWPCTGTSLC
ncbi:hypothetical protein HD806DRAFT_552377 [Xylariaceae sp. AK1471]|nr:hypothetical protein HD806DRAFT_552377 [Xylariaceae sp. AK1471]